MSTAAQTVLLDCARLSREYGMSRAVAEKVMRYLPKIEPADIRKVYVRRSDVEAFLSEWTIEPAGISRKGITCVYLSNEMEGRA